MIHLYNTLSKKIEEFKPIKKGAVSMYHCGPTVYDYAHIGNLRSFVMADVIRRTFEFNGYEVKQVINITDVGIGGDNDEGEDKMTKGLKREGKAITIESMIELGDFYTKQFKEELSALNIKTPSVMPKASEHITEDIAMISLLQEKGFAYLASDGVYFDTSKDSHYGKLGGLSQKSTEVEARVASNPNKKNVRDFALWKFNSNLGFESPWGQGFPGWHIECSAMSTKYLGNHFDIHTGGIDLAPIHHNNEIAQSESVHGKTFVNYWLHNAFVNVESGKMAKSEGTGIRLQTLIDKGYSPIDYRYWLLSAQHRTTMTFSWDALTGAKNALGKLHDHILFYGENTGKADKKLVTEFTEFLNDDFNTPRGMALMWEVIKNSHLTDSDKKATILEFDKALGLGLNSWVTFKIPDDIQELAHERDKARSNRDWVKSDELRMEIEKKGFTIRDTEGGSRVEKA